MSEHVDFTEEFEPEQYAHCGGSLEEGSVEVERR